MMETFHYSDSSVTLAILLILWFLFVVCVGWVVLKLWRYWKP